MPAKGRAESGSTQGVAFLVCPSEALIEGFVHRAHDMDPSLVRALSSHLARCGVCRQEADQRRRGLEASVTLRPWVWALLVILALGAAAAMFLDRELAGIFPPGSPHEMARPERRLAALASFRPPDAAVYASIEREVPGRSGSLSVEDRRELTAARRSLDDERAEDATRLLEDLATRHPERVGLRLVLAYAAALSGDFARARRNYGLADGLGAGRAACWGLANASLRLGDIAVARHELTAHILKRDPDDADARALLDRLVARSGRAPR